MTLHAPASNSSVWRMIGKRVAFSPAFMVCATAATALSLSQFSQTDQPPQTVEPGQYAAVADRHDLPAITPAAHLLTEEQIVSDNHASADGVEAEVTRRVADAQSTVQVASLDIAEMRERAHWRPEIGYLRPASLSSPDALWDALGTSLLLRLPDPAQVTIRAPSLAVATHRDIAPGRELFEAPRFQHQHEGPEIVTIRARGGEVLSDVLDAHSVDPDDRHATLVALRADDIAETMQSGDAIDLAMEMGLEGYNRLIAIRMRVKGKREVELRWDDDVDDVWASISLENAADPTNVSYRPVSLVEAMGESALRGGEPDRVFLQGEIRTTLYDAAEEARMTPGETRTLAEIFRYMIDFERDLHVGDRFEVMFEKKSNGDYGDILYASIENRGRRISLYRGEVSPGVYEYFDRNGKTNKRALMRTPLAYGRISSKYGMRRHPILGYQKMHRGVDFAAPTGTPILAAGDGVVEYIGRRGGYGKYIRIRHANNYKTAYAHMSRFADLRRGERIKQGSVIGYVGSTGRSTGPHLHFEVLQGSNQINPTSIADFGVLKGLEGAGLARFMANIARLNLMLAELRPHTIVADAEGRVEQ